MDVVEKTRSDVAHALLSVTGLSELVCELAMFRLLLCRCVINLSALRSMH